MLIDGFDTDRRVLIIAEIGNNHEGSYDLAARMIDLAAGAGADAVKFQTIVPDRLISAGDEQRIRQLGRFQLSYDQFARLAEVARDAGVRFLSTPFDLESVEALTPIVPAFKIASGDNDFVPLLQAVARTAKPILLSCGMMELHEVRDARLVVEDTWRDAGIEQDIALLHCVASYPAPAEQVNLAAIRRLRDAFSCTVGYSDHTLGIDAAALSVAVGARIVEKHFTLDKNHSDFRDHQLSADPAEMAELVRRIRQAEVLIGTDTKARQPCEEPSATALRRSIAAKHDLAPGIPLVWDDITWLRPAGGIAPGAESTVLGRTLKRPLRKGEPITADALA
ncbi:MAG: N-acetylneuraminate synthase family protein [Phycisphaerae bacterium]|nr:N-acetylneuraminate synthase family protein [Phycisphaerae bacterium]